MRSIAETAGHARGGHSASPHIDTTDIYASKPSVDKARLGEDRALTLIQLVCTKHSD